MTHEWKVINMHRLLYIFAVGYTVVSSLTTAASASSLISLDVRPTTFIIVQGEPLVLRWTLHNTSNSFATVRLGITHRMPLDVQFQRTDGKAVPLKPRLVKVPSWQTRTLLSLYPSSTQTGSHTFALAPASLSAGQYTVLIRVALEYSLSGSGGKVPTDGVANNEVRFPLKVVKGDGPKLVSIAREFASKVIGAAMPSEEDAALEALFAMPEGTALPVWLEVARSSRLSESGCVRTLELLRDQPSIATVDVALALWDDEKRSAIMRDSACKTIVQMWWTANPSVRKYIEQVYVTRRGDMFDTTAPFPDRLG